MSKDRLELLKHAFATSLIIAGWFALTSMSRNVLIQVIAGWVGFGILALYWRWVLRNKVR